MKYELLERYIAPLKRRVLQSVGRAIINLIDDTRGLQKLQAGLLAEETHSNVDRVQNYGFTSAPLPGAEGVFLAVGGSREHGVIVAVDDRRYRLKNLAPGEVAIYTDEGDKIHFKRGNLIEITSLAKVKTTAPEVEIVASTKVTVTSPDVEVNCDTATVNATTQVDATSPTMNLTASTAVNATTPLLNVSGVISCAGIGVGASAVAGQSNLNGNVTVSSGNVNVTGGNVSASGDVDDGAGTLAALRSAYNAHTHTETGGTTSGPTPTA